MQGWPQLRSKLTLKWGDNPKTESILGRNKEEFVFCCRTGGRERRLPPSPNFRVDHTSDELCSHPEALTNSKSDVWSTLKLGGGGELQFSRACVGTETKFLFISPKYGRSVAEWLPSGPSSCEAVTGRLQLWLQGIVSLRMISLTRFGSLFKGNTE